MSPFTTQQDGWRWPHPSPPPTVNPHPPIFLSMGPLYMHPDPSSLFPCCPPPHSALVTVRLFFISMSVVIFCLLVLLITFHFWWGHMLFVFHCLIYFTEHNSLQFHPCHCKGYKLLHSLCWVIFHSVNVPQFFLINLFIFIQLQ